MGPKNTKMKFKVSSLLALILLIGMMANAQTAALAARPSQQESPLRLSEPVEAIVVDLESYIPEYMREQDIPGVAIALIRDGKVFQIPSLMQMGKSAGMQIMDESILALLKDGKITAEEAALNGNDKNRFRVFLAQKPTAPAENGKTPSPKGTN